MARHLEDEIPRSFNRNDYADDKEKEDQLAHARYQSLEQHRFDEQQIHRTINSTYEQMSTPAARFAARLRVVELELEKDQTRTKQSKVNSSWLKAAKNKMIKPFGSWVTDINVPKNCGRFCIY